MTQPENQREEALFEEEVLRVSRALFAKNKPFQGSVILDSSERDGLFIGDDIIAVVEATVSKKLDKAKKDGKKLKQACADLSKQYPLRAVKGYFVTRDEPTAEQRQYIDRLNANVVSCSFSQLRSMLINAREYLTVRSNYPFGSARNPQTGESQDLDEYIGLGFTKSNSAGPVKAYAFGDLVERTGVGNTTILLGDFGAGKSMTMREVHRRLADRHFSNSAEPFPITLNLRDHQNQRDPDEAIRRHALSIGYEDGARLVRAWRAGEVHVLLDGFDEIATTGWLDQAFNLKAIRRRSVELIRKFADQTPPKSALFVTGRRHVFDSNDEMLSALGLKLRDPLVLTTDEFSEDQVTKYMDARGWSGGLPNWMPSRPLLLGYLATSGAMEKLVDPNYVIDAASGWSLLLDSICERESKIELGIDGPTVRRVMERLATIARSRGDGFGPVLPVDVAASFEQICGYSPDEGSYVIIQRMPGLGVIDPSNGSRHFIDTSLGDAARAGDLIHYVQNMGADKFLEEVRTTAVPMGSLGLEVAEVMALEAGITGSQVFSMASRLQRNETTTAFVFDMARLALLLDSSRPSHQLMFNDLIIDQLTFSDVNHDLSSLHFTECMISKLDLTEYDGDHALPTFSDCIFGLTLGAGSFESLPTEHFHNCSFEAFDPSSKTTRGILAMPGLSGRQKVMLSILKKVYIQPGSGRRESALLRGLDEKLKMLVPEVISALTNANLIVKGKTGGTVVYFPVRGNGPRARRMVEAGTSSNDPVLMTVK